MPRELRLDEVGAAVREVLGTAVVGVRRVGGAAGHQNFLLETLAGDLVLKAGSVEDFASAAWSCSQAAGVGVRVPQPVHRERAPGTLPLPFLLLRAVPGRPIAWGSTDLPELDRLLGRLLGRLHRIEVTGYGSLRVGDGDVRGAESTWAAAVGRMTDGLEDLVSAAVLTGSTAARARRLLSEPTLTAYSRPGCLLHGDLKLEHVLVDDDGDLGIIDWDDALVGDPLLDLGRLSIEGPEVLEPVLAGYGLELDAADRRRLVGYRLVCTIDSLTYELRAGGVGFDRGVARIEADVDLLGTPGGGI